MPTPNDKTSISTAVEDSLDALLREALNGIESIDLNAQETGATFTTPDGHEKSIEFSNTKSMADFVQCVGELSGNPALFDETYSKATPKGAVPPINSSVFDVLGTAPTPAPLHSTPTTDVDCKALLNKNNGQSR